MDFLNIFTCYKIKLIEKMQNSSFENFSKSEECDFDFNRP